MQVDRRPCRGYLESLILVTGHALADVVRDAATSVPLIYTCGRCQWTTRAANRRMIRAAIHCTEWPSWRTEAISDR